MSAIAPESRRGYTEKSVEAEDNIFVPGTVIDGKYETGRVIGTGGMGTVYEAVQLDLNRKVALKTLHPRYAKSQKIVNRFHQEAKLAGSIDHDNICRVTDHGTDKSGASYLVMPLLTGESLAGMLAGKKPLSQLRVIDIACQTLSALDAAHRRKIVHRDLKPDNIFVTQMGDREDFVKLLDFGISKVMEKESASALTSTGMVLGTAYYLAPEQARGSRNIDHRVDIYAMGVILYEALTGVRPFDGETYNEVVFKIAGEPVRMPRLLNPAISKAVERVILKAMSIDPNMRYGSAMEMCAALEQAVVDGDSVQDAAMGDTLADTLADTSVPPDTDTVQGSVRPSGRTKSLGLFIAIAVGAGLLLTAVVTVVFRSEDVPPEAPKPAAPENAPTKASSRSEADDALRSKSMTEPMPSASSTPEDTVSGAGEKTPVVAEPAELNSKNISDGQQDAAVPPSSRTPGNPRPSNRQKSKAGPKNPDEGGVIKGKFNTIFVFEDD